MVRIEPEMRPRIDELIDKNIFKDFKLVSNKLLLNGRYACSNPGLLKNGFVQSFQVLDNKDDNKK